MENLKTAIAPVGEQFLKAITPIAEFVGKILEKFNGLGDGTKKALVIVATVIGAIGPVFLMTFGLIANGAANIIKLFTTMRSGFLGLGKQSNQLAFQTQYMSSEQIEAATIAASLNQAHSKLIQTFTLESGAVDGLTNAYRRGVVAANNFAVANPGMIGPTKRKKFAAGGFVPGSGSGDTVPAMLTPGEFVVNKKSAQDNKGFLQKLNNGGFVLRNGGTPEQGQFVGGQVQTSGLHLTSAGPIHTDGPLTGKKKYAGYVIAGSQAYNQATEHNKALPYPYPLTRADAKKAIQILSQGPKTPNTTAALGALVDDYGTLNNDKAWQRGMATRYALNGALSAGEMKPGGPIFRALYGSFFRASGTNTDTSGIRNSLMRNADDLWKKGLLSDKGMAVRSNNSKSASTHLKYKTSLSSVLATLQQRTGPKDISTRGALGNLVRVDSRGNVVGASQRFQRFAATRGFSIRGMATGGPVPGYGEKDTVPALLTPGEFVVNKEATQKNGPLLEAMNSGVSVKREDGTPPTSGNPFEGIGINPQSAESAGTKFSNVVERGLSKVSNTFANTISRALLGSTKDALNNQASMQNPVSTLPSGERVSAGGIIIPVGVKDPSEDKEKQATKQTTKRRFGRFGRGGGVAGGQDLEALRVRNQMMMQKANMAAFGLSAVAQGASMMGGGIADKVAPMMTAASGAIMAMSMIQGPISAAVVGIGAIALAAVMVRRSFDKAQDETLAFAEQMGASSKNIRMFAEATGKVSAGEVMERRRKEKTGIYQIQPGKKTFGQAFAEGEQGKQMTKDVGKNIKQSGQAGAQSALVSQMATAVSSGAMSAEQARSVVANIAQELGDASFGMSVNAQLISILGPSGENLMTDPLTVRTKLIQDTRERMSAAEAATNKSTRITGMDAINVGGYAAAGAGVGAAGGAAVGSMILPVVGTAIGAVVGAIGGAIAGAVYGRKDRAKRLGESSGAQVALQKIALEQQQELLDSMDLEYQKKIELLKAEGKIVEAKKLQKEYDANRQKLVEENQKTTEQITDSFATSKAQSQLMTGVDKAITSKYKGTALEDVATLSKSTIDDMELKDEQKYTLKMQLASGQLDPMQVLDIVDIFKTKEDQEKFFEITTKFGGAVSNEALDVASMFAGKDGTETELQKKIMLEVGAAKTPQEAQEKIDFWNKISKLGGVLDVSIVGKVISEDGDKQKRLMDIFKQIDAKKGKIKLEVATKMLGSSPEAIKTLNENLDYYNALPAEQQKIYLTSLITTTETVDANSTDFQAYLKETGANARQMEQKGFLESKKREFAHFKSQQLTKTALDKSGVPGSGKKTGGGERDTTFDDLLMRLKMVQSSSINATGGLKELKRVMSGKDKISLTKFKGIDQQLLGNNKVSQEFLDFVDSLGPEGIQKDLKQFVTTGKDGLMTLNEAGQAIMRGMVAAKLGEYQVGIRNNVLALNQQIQATSKLIKAGFSFAEAQELAKDQTLALAIANGELNPEQLKKLKVQTQELTKAQQQYERVTKVALMDEMDGQKARFEMVQKFVALQEQLIENQYASEKAVLSSRQAANEYALEKISQEEEKINEKYDKQIEALDKIAAKQEEINQIQQRRFNLAQALASGDMAGAAGAIQEIRQAEAAAQIERKRKAIEDARKKQLSGVQSGGKTREQIEADNKAIVNTLSDIEEKIRLAKNALDDQLKKTIGMTRVEIESAVTGIAKALDAGIDPNNKDFLGQILKGVVGDATATVTALKLVGTEIETLLKAQSDAKKKYDNSGEFEDETLKKEQQAKADAAKAALDKAALEAEALKKAEEEKIKKFTDQLLQYVVVGGTIIPINKPLKTENKSGTSGNSTKDNSVTDKSGGTATTIYSGGYSGIPVTKTTQMTKVIPASGGHSGIPYTPARTVIVKKAKGGMIVPAKYAMGGFATGTDTVPAMLTPGEFVIQKRAVDMLGTGVMNKINDGELPGNSVYNYSLSVNVSNSNANPNDIARTVINQIKQIDSQRIRGSR